MGFDVFEIDAEVVGGVTESVGAEIGREEFGRFLADVNSGGGFDGGEVLGEGEAAGEFFWICQEEVGGGVNVLAGPGSSGGDPFLEMGFFFGRKWSAFFGHFVGFDGLPNEALFEVSGRDDVGVEEGGALLGEVEIAFVSGGVVALETMTGNDGFDVINEEILASLGRSLRGRGFVPFCGEGDDFGFGEGGGVEGDLVEDAEPRAVFREFVAEGEAEVLVPVVEVTGEFLLAGFLAVEVEGALTIAGADEDNVGFSGGDASGGEGGDAVGTGGLGAEAGVEFCAVLAEGEVAV